MHFLYFDPGLGAMIIQVIVAGVAGFFLFSKNLFFRIKLFLGIAKNDKSDLFDDIDVKESDVETKNNSEK